MAKGKYKEWLEPDGLLLISAWARDGLTDEQIAHNMGVNVRTLYEYKNKYPQISQSLKKGKEVVDYEVENALLKRAMGYVSTEVIKERLADTGQKKRHNGEGELTEREWNIAIKYFDNKCCYCGEYMDEPTKDHILALKKGGQLSPDNIIPCCRTCNSSKNDRNLEEWYKEQSFFDRRRLSKIYDYVKFISELSKMGDLGELVVTKEITKEVPPDTTAIIFWLKNRQPQKWRDKQQVEMSGELKHTNPFEGLTTNELKKLVGDG